MVRRLIIVTTALIVVTATYGISPFWAAWQLRSAIKAGDIAGVERRVNWPRLRASLRQSLADAAELMPTARPSNLAARPPGLWARLKAAVGRQVIERFITAYITPAGLIKLDRMRNNTPQPAMSQAAAGRLHLAAASTEALARSSTKQSELARLGNFLQRVRRAEFLSLQRVELEVIDERDARRVFIARFEIEEMAWKLTGLKVRKLSPAGRADRPA